MGANNTQWSWLMGSIYNASGDCIAIPRMGADAELKKLVDAANDAESARRECEQLRSVLWQIATDDDLVYMGCSDIPHCGGRTQGDPIHQPDCVIGVAQRALGIDNHGNPFLLAGTALSGEAPPEPRGGRG